MTEQVTTNVTETEGTTPAVTAPTPSLATATVEKPADGAVQTPEQLAEAEKAKAEAEAKDKAKSEGAPEKYEDFTLPEGWQMVPERLENFVKEAKDLNLSQTSAQKILDMHVEAMKLESQRQNELWENTRDQWRTSSKSDKEFGGVNLEKNLGLVTKALERFGTPELLELADSYGMGDHPEFLRLLYRVGKAMGEDSMHNGIGGAAGVKDPAKVLFPNQN